MQISPDQGMLLMKLCGFREGLRPNENREWRGGLLTLNLEEISVPAVLRSGPDISPESVLAFFEAGSIRAQR